MTLWKWRYPPKQALWAVARLPPCMHRDNSLFFFFFFFFLLFSIFYVETCADRRPAGSTTISALTMPTTPKNPSTQSSTTFSRSTAPKSQRSPATTQTLKSVLIGRSVITPSTSILPNPAFQISQARNTNSGKTLPKPAPPRAPLISPGGREVYSPPPCNLIWHIHPRRRLTAGEQDRRTVFEWIHAGQGVSRRDVPVDGVGVGDE